ncbi:hypothetical protein [Pseudoalteromonas sp. R3]|uniref:hypothetical protein n=1 Tax=Pseudoalteromonas sp. R3 TaxID=1709477 RepID=UPI00128F7542|nr:hypothetical protein [Pseudoalteromonas sp. R3]
MAAWKSQAFSVAVDGSRLVGRDDRLGLLAAWKSQTFSVAVSGSRLVGRDNGLGFWLYGNHRLSRWR